MPTAWYNILADLPNPPSPYLHPGTKELIGPADLTPIFPEALILQ
jgi:tryptophan synthase beta chain